MSAGLRRVLQSITQTGRLHTICGAESRVLIDPQARDDAGRDGGGAMLPCDVSVGAMRISAKEIDREMAFYSADDPKQVRADAARTLVVRALLCLEIERLGIGVEVQPDETESAEDAAVRVLLDREVARHIPDEEECRRYYRQNSANMHAPDRILARHILLAAAPVDFETRQRMREMGRHLIAELRISPDRFSGFAQQYSSCPSKDRGGVLGWLEQGQTTPEFERQLFRMAEGLAGDPLESRWGFHVVSIDAIERGALLPFERIRQHISDYLERHRWQSDVHRYLKALHERYPVRGLVEIEAAAKGSGRG